MFVNKMYLILYLICIIKFVNVHCECSDYKDCIRDALSDLIGVKNDTGSENKTIDYRFVVINTNNTDGDEESKKLEDEYLSHDKMLKDVENESKFNVFNSGIWDEISSLILKSIGDTISAVSETFEHSDNKTEIFVKVFDFNDNTKNISFEEDLKEFTIVPETVKMNNSIENILTEFNNNLDSAHNIQEKQSNVKDILHIKDVRENEIQKNDDFENYYDEREDNSTDYPIIDYIELYKDTTNEDVDYKPTDPPINITEVLSKQENEIENVIEYALHKVIDDAEGNFHFNGDISNTCQYNASSNDLTDVVFPWIATIFIKNDTNSNQFEYYCDGALLSDQVIVTAGRCVINAKGGVGPDDFIVVLGKRSLQSAGDNEKAHKLKEIRLHENFTNENGKVQNDLAILVLEEPTVLNRMIIPSCIGNGESEEVKEAFTTGWGVSGALTPIHLDTNKLGPCDNGVTGENIFCGTYVNDVTVCPSYGGVYAAKQSDTWYLQGVLFGDPARRGICIDKTIAFTSIKNYTDWINEYIKV